MNSFLRGLKGEADANNDGKITAGELRQYIEREVPFRARCLNNIEQNPVFWGDDDKIIAEY